MKLGYSGGKKRRSKGNAKQLGCISTENVAAAAVGKSVITAQAFTCSVMVTITYNGMEVYRGSQRAICAR